MIEGGVKRSTIPTGTPSMIPTDQTGDEEEMIENIIENVNVGGGEGDGSVEAEPEQDGAGEAAPSCEGAGAYADTQDGPSGQGVEGN